MPGQRLRGIIFRIMDIKTFLDEKKLDPALAGLFYSMTELVLDWNERINLTAIREASEFMRKNIIDSLALCGAPELENALSVLDMGTGGGFPGLPLAAAFPEKSFVLADSVGKKLRAVDDVAYRLGLSNVKTLHSRAEDLGHMREYREKFDLVVSRAVAELSVLAEYCLPLVRQGGCFIAYKTESSAEEIEAAKPAIGMLGGRFAELRTDGIDGSGHVFAVIEKRSATAKIYPRKAGIPSKKPLA